MRALRLVPGIALALVVAVQAARVLLIPAPGIDLARARLVVPRFDDARCRARVLELASSSAEQWSLHPGDGGARSQCVSASLDLSNATHVLVRYAGYPGTTGVAMGLDVDGDGSIDHALAAEGAAGHGWRVAVAALPDDPRLAGAQFVIDDRSTAPDGWLVADALVPFSGEARGLDGVRASPPRIAAAIAVALAAALLWLALAGRHVVASLAMAALVATVLVQASSFYATDEYVLLTAFSDGVAWRDLVSYYDQFAPLFLAGYAGAAGLAGAWYAPLQLAMLAGHVGVSLLLVRLLLRHGFAPLAAWGAGVLYATSWSHLDVVPWFMESCFLVSTGLTLVALERSAARSLAAAAFSAALAPLVFAGGVVAPWLCLLHVLVFDRHDRRALAAFAAIGVAAVAVILASSSALDSARAVATGAPLADVAGFVVRGALASSLASLLALRGHAWIAVTLAGVLAFVALIRGEDARGTLRSLAFGGAWLVAAYALQAAVRTGTGYGEAMAFRYTYFGMTAAAFLLAAALDPLLRLRGRLVPCACIAGVLVAAGFNAAIFANRMAREEGEYFAIARQYFAITAAAIREGAPLTHAVLPKTLLPAGASAATYPQTVCWLSRCPPAAGTQPRPADESAQVLAALLAPR